MREAPALRTMVRFLRHV